MPAGAQPQYSSFEADGNNIISIEALIFADYPQLKSLNLSKPHLSKNRTAYTR